VIRMIQVIAGVDTHSQTHHCAVVTVTGEHLADAQFPATRPGYEALQAFMTSCVSEWKAQTHTGPD
jgi:transposase